MVIERKDKHFNLVCKERDYYALNFLNYRNFDSGSSLQRFSLNKILKETKNQKAIIPNLRNLPQAH